MDYKTVINRSNIHDDQVRRDYSNKIRFWNPRRAEFINVQLDMRSKDLTEDSWLVLHERSIELLVKNGQKWVPKRLVDYKPTFYRGFIESIDLNAGLFLKKVKEVYSLAPIRHLVLRKTNNVAYELFNSPHLSDIVSLSFTKNRQINDKLTDKEVELIANSSYLKNLVILELRSNDITEEGLEMLASSKNLPNLQYVGISGNEKLSEGFEKIMKNGVVEQTSLGERLAEIGNKNKSWLNRLKNGQLKTPVLSDI